MKRVPTMLYCRALIFACVLAQSQTSITQLLSGGLDAKYWNNQWMVGTPVIHRIDPQVRGPRPMACREHILQKYLLARVRVVWTVHDVAAYK